VQLLLISSDEFGEGLTYKVNGEGNPVKLDAPLLLMGDGAVKLLGEAPKSLSFTNGLNKPATAEILIARNVADSPES
jgi:hypothetical protein